MSLEVFYSRAGHLIRRLNQISVALFLEEAGNHDLTPRQYAALKMIDEIPNIDQMTLSNMIAMDKTTMVKVIDRLMEKGLVTRTRSPQDRRINLLNVTPACRGMLDQIERQLDRSEARILAPLNKSEQHVFMEMLTRLVDVNNAYSRAPLDASRMDDAAVQGRISQGASKAGKTGRTDRARAAKSTAATAAGSADAAAS
ncbi:MarR family winged helix-turn-helix transcriptional regulator, partial [Cupriavidus basilensis]|uniref:MarR family winged helix-turn-helix transcriptional regulator n=1 Tax=Cupriavidus basilensis TaxID=68895 RepID=UPI0028495807